MWLGGPIKIVTQREYIYIYIEKQGGGIYLYENGCVSITTNKVNKC